MYETRVTEDKAGGTVDLDHKFFTCLREVESYILW